MERMITRRIVDILIRIVVAAALIAVCFMVSGIVSWAEPVHETTVDGVTYQYSKLSAYTAVIVSVDPNGASVIDIPGEIEHMEDGTAKTLQVTKVSWAIAPDCSALEELNLPDSVTSLYGNFRKCTSLKRVYLNNSEFLSLMNTETSQVALGELSTLESVTVSPTNKKFCSIDGVVFSRDKSNLSLYPRGKKDESYTIPEGVKYIGCFAFQSPAALKKLSLPSTFCKVDTMSGLNGLETLDIGKSSAELRDFPYIKNPSIKKIEASGDNPVYSAADGVLYDKTMTTIMVYPLGKTDSRFVIPDGVTSFDLSGCSFSEVVIPMSVEDIPNCAFQECKNLKSIDLPYLTKSIGNDAFRGCTSLESIFIPPLVASIGDFAMPYTVIKGARDTYAEEYADLCGYPFEEVVPEQICQGDGIFELTGISKGKAAVGDKFRIKAKAYTDVSYESSDSDVIKVDNDGNCHAVGVGTCTVTASAEETDIFMGAEDEYKITVNPGTQSISGDSSFTVEFGKKLKLGSVFSAKTQLSYAIVAGNGFAKVTKSGKVSFTRPGTATVKVVAAASDDYKAASKTVTVKCAVGTPKLKVKGKKGAAKLTWSKVRNAAGYQLYIKYPGSKKFKKVLTKSAKVKSVTHRGITKGQKYCYKVRAFAKVNGKMYYSSYSEALAVTAK